MAMLKIFASFPHGMDARGERVTTQRIRQAGRQAMVDAWCLEFTQWGRWRGWIKIRFVKEQCFPFGVKMPWRDIKIARVEVSVSSYNFVGWVCTGWPAGEGERRAGCGFNGSIKLNR